MDSSNAITTTAVGGMRNSLARTLVAAEELTESVIERKTEGPEAMEAMATLVVEPKVYQANAAVIKTYDETVGTLLDHVA